MRQTAGAKFSLGFSHFHAVLAKKAQNTPKEK
jgi:hypothetical protein